MPDQPMEPWIMMGTQMDKNGRDRVIGMPMADFQTHASIVGATGSGKSTLLRNLNLMFFEQGASTIVIEPHGDLVDDILSGIDDARLSRAVVLDLNSLFPPAIPLLTVGLTSNGDVAKQMAMSVLRVADSANWDASGQMREVLRHAINVMLDAYGEEANLVYLKRFMTEGDQDAEFRERTLGMCSREVSDSREFCYKIKASLEGEKGGTDLKVSVRTAMRRVDIFLEDRRFRRSLALPQLGPVISLPRLMMGNRLILAPVRKSELGETNMKIFGTLLMWMTIRGLMARGDRKDRKQVAITMDEFATMAGSEAGDLTKQGLAEARKYGASIVLAMQFLAQLPKDVLEEVKTNTLTKIIMSLPDDEQARVAVNMLAHPDLTPPDIQAIEKFHYYGKLVAHKAVFPACYLKAFPPVVLEAMEGAGAVDIPARPQLSEDTTYFLTMAAPVEDFPDDTRLSRELIDQLCDLDDDTFVGIVAEIAQLNRYVASVMLADPDTEPDRVVRAKRISGYFWGLQWWLRDAYYWRLRESGRKKTKRKVSTMRPVVLPTAEDAVNL